VAANIYRSSDIDQTDSTGERSYKNSRVNHMGSYFDPGMEFDNDKENWNLPFSGKGKRIIKSHTFAHQLYELKTLKYPIVMVYRNDVECFKWWQEAGGFNITYPNYSYYETLDKMWERIQDQNKSIMTFIKNHSKKINKPVDNVDLCRLLQINFPDTKGRIHNYAQNDIQVYVYK
jgi:hypothetical protein